MNTTTELLNQLNDMQSKHIETLEEKTLSEVWYDI